MLQLLECEWSACLNFLCFSVLMRRTRARPRQKGKHNPQRRPCLAYQMPSESRAYVQKFTQGGFASDFQYGLVHEPILLRDKSEAKSSSRLNNLPAWDCTRDKPEADVVWDSRDKHRSVNFTSLKDLRHKKHAELAQHFQKFSRRSDIAVGATSETVTVFELCSPNKAHELPKWPQQKITR